MERDNKVYEAELEVRRLERTEQVAGHRYRGIVGGGWLGWPGWQALAAACMAWDAGAAITGRDSGACPILCEILEGSCGVVRVLLPTRNYATPCRPGMMT